MREETYDIAIIRRSLRSGEIEQMRDDIRDLQEQLHEAEHQADIAQARVSQVEHELREAEGRLSRALARYRADYGTEPEQV